MKNYLFILLLCFTIRSAAQAPTPVVDPKATVKDESGVLLPYFVWQKMMQSGDYNLKRTDPNTAEYVLQKLTKEEKNIALERRQALVKTLPKPKTSDSFKEGTKFSGEKITAMNGNKFDLRKADGKIYVLNFWFINCPPCKKEIPELNDMVAKYKENKDVVFLAIALDQYNDLKDFLKSMPFLYNVVDDGRYFSTKYGVKGYPTHVVIGKDGLIKFSTLGLAPNTIYWLDKTIGEQLTGI